MAAGAQGVDRVSFVTPIEGSKSGAFALPPRRDNTRAFRAARRHSRLVRTLRVGIPVLMLAAAVGLGLYRWLDPMQALAKLPVSADGLVVSGTKIVMRQPRLTGYTRDQRPYTVAARSAAKDLAKPDLLELEGIRTSMAMADGGTVQVTADEGLYDGKAETIRLQNNIVVSGPEYEILLREAVVNVRGGSVVSEQPIEVKMLQGTLSANRLEVSESGQVIRFDQGVTLVFDGAAVQNRTVAGDRR